jgi:hypothetical protein
MMAVAVGDAERAVPVEPVTRSVPDPSGRRFCGPCSRAAARQRGPPQCALAISHHQALVTVCDVQVAFHDEISFAVHSIIV